jgi:Phage major capsid protein E
MALIDAFSGKTFQQTSLGDAFKIIPNRYSRVRGLNLFRNRPISTTSVQIEKRSGILSLLPTGVRGGNDGAVIRTPKPEADIFPLYHIPAKAFIYADDIQNVRQWGSESQPQMLSDLMTDKMETLVDAFDETEEFMLNMSLQGKLFNAQGTQLQDWFARFGYTEKLVDFNFASPTEDMGLKNMEILRHIEDGLMGDTMTGVHALCSEGFFDSYTNHPTVKEAYDKYSSFQEPNRNDVRRGFFHKGITFEEYRGKASVLNADGTFTLKKYIPDGEARFFPLGTRQTFETYWGPADYISEANKPGQMRYIRLMPDPGDKFVQLDAQINFLPMCKRPNVLVRGTA